MGAGAAGNFGHTKGSVDLKSFLDTLSGLLAIASLIPVADTAIDIAALLVDLLRGDYVSAALDLAGVIPFVGEAADTARIAKVTDKTIDAVKTAKKVDKAVDISKTTKTATNFKSFPKKIHIGQQGKHILGHNNYKKGKSILDISISDAQQLINKYSGKGRKIGTNREVVNFKKVIGKYVDPKTGKSYYTTVGTIHYSKSGTHLVPEKPINWRT